MQPSDSQASEQYATLKIVKIQEIKALGQLTNSMIVFPDKKHPVVNISML